jgi:hypothetical protein
MREIPLPVVMGAAGRAVQVLYPKIVINVSHLQKFSAGDGSYLSLCLGMAIISRFAGGAVFGLCSVLELSTRQSCEPKSDCGSLYMWANGNYYCGPSPTSTGDFGPPVYCASEEPTQTIRPKHCRFQLP